MTVSKREEYSRIKPDPTTPVGAVQILKRQVDRSRHALEHMSSQAAEGGDDALVECLQDASNHFAAAQETLHDAIRIARGRPHPLQREEKKSRAKS